MGKRIRKSITLDPNLYDWILKGIETMKFADFSHACNLAIHELKRKEEKKQE